MLELAVFWILFEGWSHVCVNLSLTMECWIHVFLKIYKHLKTALIMQLWYWYTQNNVKLLATRKTCVRVSKSNYNRKTVTCSTKLFNLISMVGIIKNMLWRICICQIAWLFNWYRLICWKNSKGVLLHYMYSMLTYTLLRLADMADSLRFV